jgi:hypothetical protein
MRKNVPPSKRRASASSGKFAAVIGARTVV